MASKRFVALLRGINVGGKNLMSMAELRGAFEAHGFDDVATYIQSGNVLFEADGWKQDALTREIERMLSDTFAADISVVLRSHEELTRVVADAPAGFGEDPETYRYDVIFLKDPLTTATAMADVTTRDGVDRAAAGPGVLYFSRLTAKATRSHLSRLTGKPVYKQMTIRNWNTTTKLLAKLDERVR